MALCLRTTRHTLAKFKPGTVNANDSTTTRLFSTLLESQYQPLATALSDTMSPSLFEQSQVLPSDSADNIYWSQYRPYATALSDIMSPSLYEQIDRVVSHGRSSRRAFATPISDTLSPSPYEQMERHSCDESEDASEHRRQYATALSDFISPSEFEQKDLKDEWSGNVSFASPESDFSACNDIEYLSRTIPKSDEFKSSMSYALALASPESDFTSLPLTDQMRLQLGNAESANFHTNPLHLQEPLMSEEEQALIVLPKSYEEAIHESHEAIVVTELTAPFRIVSVSAPWEKLCGFSHKESIGMTLEILQGPLTDKATLSHLLSRTLKGEETGTELINYDKNGRKFHNRLTLGPLKDEQNRITHFVGLLRDINAQKEAMHVRVNQV